MSAGVLRACEFIAAHIDEPLTLERIAGEVGWSPFHLQRVFRAGLGVSPKHYARRLRFERFQKLAHAGVIGAQYDAGFGSSSRLYERARAELGMTPAAVARKGAGMKIAYDLFPCPLGTALIAATPLGICAVKFGRAVADLRAQFPRAEIRRDPRLLRFARRRLDAIFAGAVDPCLPLDIRATAFQARVWASLRAIPYGQTRSYAQIARAVGRPRAVRAVARACATNPVAVLIPCHRAVGSDGALRGYRWGLSRKRALLRVETDAAPGRKLV